MKILLVVSIVAAVIALLLGGVHGYFVCIANPRMVQELSENPDGERARRVTLLTLPAGRQLPVNYLREDARIYAAADGSWWKELVGEGSSVKLLVRGQTLTGHARAIRDDPSYTKQVFAKLRPDAIEGFGTLIEIRLEESDAP